uniref:Secreted protein n=1 Tax=Panagrellus redivivus TaxID=6233 RepID=A0A7E4VG45_PANRE
MFASDKKRIDTTQWPRLFLTIGLILLVLSSAAHNCKPGPKIKSLKRHGCPAAAWTYGPSEFTFVSARKHSSILRRQVL